MPPPSTACSSPADLAPPGHWCNGTQLVRSSEPPQTLVRRGLSGAGDADGADDSLFPSAAIHGHGSRRLEAGGLSYDCNTCTGAATPWCGGCYWKAKSHFEDNGAGR
ncbi:hypothetical protein EMIHUDRAFT_220771 [Emiliania huxleyi CCMP1516]|uniref:Uncharacterized protein n=2 Tax=Emiliania huxleyi TaxID=2903 RepID=A0A0D3I089_EMIH1|nr:hypothetical protein EMIHUDRAFT_220771 [Emiliania huxleyi CCMP1516]EOD04674.1 hypothetical protein EMIHUDRAFT_220771 [Emiliania huxleyi CCMP1516]|eukprot:XP_005757103.1 hypothetical protein EMIHUDRAFT_220771 [Emiliania huxleyi CCMP1516]